MNILLLSAGTRNKIVQYFKQAVGSDGIVVATDMSNLAPAIYNADKFYIVPRMTDDHYIDMITPVLSKDGKIRVFTDEQHFISQDCRHLSMFGAQYYAKVLDLSMLQP